MRTLKFTAKIKNGAIEVPEEYRAQLSELVKAVLTNASHASAPDLIDHLLKTPLQAADFKPMARNEIHDPCH